MRLAFLGFIGVLAAVIAGRTLLTPSAPRAEAARPEAPPAIETAPMPREVKRKPEDVAKPHLTKAEQESARVMEAHIQELDAFFEEARKNTKPFAADALGWGSKFRLAADYVPFTSKDRHRKYIREKFEERFFKPEQLEAAVKQVVKNYLAHVGSIENQMLVDLRADAHDFPTVQIDQPKLQEAYDAALADALAAVSVKEDIASFAVSTVTAEVFTQVAVQLGLRTGILGAGAVSGTMTFGIGLVVGLIVDQIVCYVWEWYSDPKGELADAMENKLDDIQALADKGLREQLRKFARERATTRNHVVVSLLGGAP